MHKITLPIDTKSLYYNILNDNTKGHTCTVATPIKQGNSVNQNLCEIYKIPKQIDFESYPRLVNELTKNSKSIVRINNVFVFEKIKVNDVFLEIDSSFCFYTKEEIDRTRAQFGRIKLHYPMTLKYDDLKINNRRIINAISDRLNGYAFIVESFEYCFDDDSLNFNVLIVGYSNIPYSKVFINNKGVGNKYSTLIKNNFDLYDTEIIPLRKKYGEGVSTVNFDTYMEEGKNKAKKIVLKYLLSRNVTNEETTLTIRDISEDYPYALFDFQYYQNGRIHYALIFGTYSKVKYFNLTSFQNQFINLFDEVSIFLVTDIDGLNSIHEINKKELKNYCVQMNVVRFVEGELPNVRRDY